MILRIVQRPGVDLKEIGPDKPLLSEEYSPGELYKRQKGFQRVIWGASLTNPGEVFSLSFWDSKEAVEAFNASEDAKQMYQKLQYTPPEIKLYEVYRDVQK